MAYTDWANWIGAFSAVDHLALCYLRRPFDVGYACRPPHLCLADLLAQVFVVVHDVRDRQNIARVIYRLLASFKGTFRTLDIIDSPFLLEFLATKAFDQKHNADSFAGALNFLSPSSVRTTDVMMQRFWRALALTLHAAPVRSDIATVDHPNLWSVCYDIQLLSQTTKNAVSTLNAVLRPVVSPPVDQSIWSMIRRFGLDWISIPLAERLATALCISIRREDILVHEQPLLINSFLAEMSPSDVVTALTKSHWDARQNAFTHTNHETMAVHLIQHCIELQSDWWLAVLDYAQHSQSEGERRMVLALQDELARRGSCVTCPEELRI